MFICRIYNCGSHYTLACPPQKSDHTLPQGMVTVLDENLQHYEKGIAYKDQISD
jgi:hypothetical protein